ncbi:hypothetical protein ACFQ6C_30040 [Streptomyces sp. NPDC056454]|uniref:hypothetical protein n=1 Tax=Streptomyces sp. NPDC056454 TaxID=3345823 RepID=UPI0036807709
MLYAPVRIETEIVRHKRLGTFTVPASGGPAYATPAPPAEALEPEAWPEIGETWKPEGLPVVERYYNQAHAVVLVARTGQDP